MIDWTKEAYQGQILSVDCFDVRFPSVLIPDAPSDALHKDPDFSDAYVIVKTDKSSFEGHGFTFTVGRGQEVVVKAIESLSALVKGRQLIDIFRQFGEFWKELTCESQLRWIGPEKGAIHLATAAIVNSLWDLWAKIENKPLWKLLVDMDSDTLLSTIDFRYITDALTKEEAKEILRQNADTKLEREKEIIDTGVPAYITSVGWLGIPTDRLKEVAFSHVLTGVKGMFIPDGMKMKVGLSLEDDRRRAGILRKILGDHGALMTDANQRWDVGNAIDWMRELVPFAPLWIEEPTSPDDVLGHLAISQALRDVGIGVATGEHCQNRVIFKQLLASGAMQFCQIDACRLAGVNEVLSVLLMARKFNVPVCPHAGGVGLCELVQHLSIFNYIAVSPTWHNVMVEYLDQYHEYFVDPVKVGPGCYRVPTMPGYSAQFKTGVIEEYEFPRGSVWKKLLQK